MKLRRHATALFAATALAAASPASAEIVDLNFEADTIGQMAVSGQGFTDELARDYRYLAEFERDAMVDWPDAEFFADKAVAAKQGDRLLPERVEDWSIDSEAARSELQAARARLVNALARGRTSHPNTASQAQAYFDCWVEQQEEGWQKSHIAGCREKFHLAMSRLEGLLAPKDVEPFSVQGMEEIGVVFFPFDKAVLTPENRRTLDMLATLLPDRANTEVVIAGHADRSGPRGYNQELSEARAKAVADYLADKGFTETRVETFDVEAYGERRPAIPTADGVRMPENRRVKIEVDTEAG